MDNLNDIATEKMGELLTRCGYGNTGALQDLGDAIAIALSDALDVREIYEPREQYTFTSTTLRKHYVDRRWDIIGRMFDDMRHGISKERDAGDFHCITRIRLSPIECPGDVKWMDEVGFEILVDFA